MLEKEFPILTRLLTPKPARHARAAVADGRSDGGQERKINGRRLVYLDNASTTQKPEMVIRAMDDFYRRHNANIHRGIHTLSQEATSLYEGARNKAQKFINAKHREEIIFTSGATEAINLVVWTWGHENIHRGDEILLTEMEHHSNLVPWQVLAKKKGARLKFIPVNVSPLPPPASQARALRAGNPPPPGEGMKRGKGRVMRGKTPLSWRGERLQPEILDLTSLDKLITHRTKIVSLTHVSNVLGTINPIEKVIKAVRQRRIKAKVLIDGAQAGAHLEIDVQKLGCDFYVLSGHKMYGPTGVGMLYGRRELLEKMPPYQSGGHMIKRVEWQRSTWADLPHKFEAGTANIAAVIGLGAAVDFINKIGIKRITDYELRTTDYALRKLQEIPGIVIYARPNYSRERGPVIAFNVSGIPPHDLASILDEQGIAIRTGHHCAMPLHRRLGIESSARASFALYNTQADVDALIKGIKHAIEIFGNLTPSLSDLPDTLRESMRAGIGEGERER